MSKKNSTPLTAELVRELFDYDPETGVITRKKRFTMQKHSGSHYQRINMVIWL